MNSKMTFAAMIVGAVSGVTAVSPTDASAAEVNLYSERQPFLMDPLLKAFTKETEIKVNMVYLTKGMQERLKAEGANSPADLVLTSDVGHLHNLVMAELLQASQPKTVWRVCSVRCRVLLWRDCNPHRRSCWISTVDLFDVRVRAHG